MIMDVADAAEVSSSAFHEEALSLHEWSDAWESTRRNKEAPDNSDRIAALEEELALAKEKGVELEVIPVVKEGFVFYVNSKNSVDKIGRASCRERV
mgnify:CR=1 FL=1